MSETKTLSIVSQAHWGEAPYHVSFSLIIDRLFSSPREVIKTSCGSLNAAHLNDECGRFLEVLTLLGPFPANCCQALVLFVNTCTDLLVWPWAALRVKGQRVVICCACFLRMHHTLNFFVLWFARCVFCLCFHWKPAALMERFTVSARFLQRAWFKHPVFCSECEYFSTLGGQSLLWITVKLSFIFDASRSRNGCKADIKLLWVSSFKEMNVKLWEIPLFSFSCYITTFKSLG